MINKNAYFPVYRWMTEELDLKYGELMLFALIHNFTEKYGCYSGSLLYLEKWLRSSKWTVIKWLNDLVAKGYVTKTKGGGASFEYRSKKVTSGVKKDDPGGKKTLPGEVIKSDPENKWKKNKETISETRVRAKVRDPGAGSFDAKDFFEAALNRSYRDFARRDAE